jgi:hypothetical protein
LGIRGRLLLLAVGIAVPLVLVGVADLRGMWRVSRSQLDDSVKQQAELAAKALSSAVSHAPYKDCAERRKPSAVET